MTKRKAVIVDCDGTLVNVDSALHHILTPGKKKDFDAFHVSTSKCPPRQWVLDWCEEHLDQGHELVVVTGRMYRHYDSTLDWLERHLPSFHGPFMRGDDDFRADTEVKKDIYDILVNDFGFDIVAAIDDRPSVVALWKSLDIPTTVVKSGNWESSGESYE